MSQVGSEPLEGARLKPGPTVAAASTAVGAGVGILRAALVVILAEQRAHAVATGDLEAARITQGAIGQLLDASRSVVSRGAASPPGDVTTDGEAPAAVSGNPGAVSEAAPEPAPVDVGEGPALVPEFRPHTGSAPAVALLYELAGTMVRAAAAGELRTAQATHAAIGALLGSPPVDKLGVKEAPVVDLGAAREHRGRGRSR
jgi:hypothetical protein